MNAKQRLHYSAYMAAYQVINRTDSIFDESSRIRKHTDGAMIAAGLGLIACDRRYLASARKRARDILDVLICG